MENGPKTASSKSLGRGTSQGGIVGSGGEWVSNRGSWMPSTVAFGMKGLGLVEETALTSMVIIGRMVNLPV